MDRPTCVTCPFWEDFNEMPEPDIHGNPMGTPGSCRVGRPQLPLTEAAIDHGGDPFFAMWPNTDSNEWCGEHPDFPAYIAGLKDATQPALQCE
jgi:hypothetical protein